MTTPALGPTLSRMREDATLATCAPARTEAPGKHAPTVLWMRPLGLTAIAVVIALSVSERPSPALHGSGLSVLAALLVLVASIAALVLRPSTEVVGAAALIAMITASFTLLWTQHTGVAVAPLFLAVSYAALRLSMRRSLAMLALAVGSYAATSAHAQHPLAASELGIVAFYVIAAFTRRVQEDHEQTKRLLAELEDSRNSREEAAALRERSRIAREVHDVLAHSLSGLMLQLEGARMLAAIPNANGQLPAALERAHRLARAGLEEARRAIGALRDEDLPGADRLEQLTAEFSRDSSVQATFEVMGVPQRLDSETSLTVFRVAQEALTNSRKHAQPSRVELHLSYLPDGTRLVVQDHGDSEAAISPVTAGLSTQIRGGEPQGYGLTGMRERAELLGGRLDAGPTSDGFRVELWVPA